MPQSYGRESRISELLQKYSLFLVCIEYYCINLRRWLNNYAMKKKANRLDTIKLIISSKEIGSQGELLKELRDEGFALTQATLSRDLKQLKVAKAATISGKYVYVLPNDIMYKRSTDRSVSATEMLRSNGFISLQFSGNIAVIRTRPGYASSMAYDIDAQEAECILGTIAGDDTILLVLREGERKERIVNTLAAVIPDIR